MTSVDLPATGSRIRFQDGDKVSVGTVNGEAKDFGNYGEPCWMVPVYHHETDRCLMVPTSNLRGSA